MVASEQTPRILVVDDEHGIRYFLERFLKREGFQVATAASGEEAIDCLATDEFDMVLVDLKMKGIGGLEVLAFVQEKWPATAVIVLTAHATLESAVEALRKGAHDYLFKPCRTVDLRESIRTGLLKRQQQRQLRQLQLQSAPSVAEESTTPAQPAMPNPAAALRLSEEYGRFLQYGSLIVDSIRHIITVDGTLLELSPTEFDLLAYLISEAPRVVPPQELIYEVHGYDSQAYEAAETIRAHMYHIRQKVKSATNRTIIRTVRGVGYSLAE
jgi:DNA-binding response OmpR family regulator